MLPCYRCFSLSASEETPQGEKSSQDDGWQESCNLPRVWRSKEKLINFKEDRKPCPVEKSSRDDSWLESCNLPRGWRSNKKLLNFKEDRETPHVEKPSQDDGWQEIWEPPTGWRSKEKQSNFKEDRGTSNVEKPSQDDDRQESCYLPKGWMSKEKQPNFKEDRGTSQVDVNQLNLKEAKGTSHAENSCHKDGWKDSCELLSGRRIPECQRKQSILEEERQVIYKQHQQPTRNRQALRNQVYPDSEEGCLENGCLLLINSQTKPKHITWLKLAKPKQPP